MLPQVLVACFARQVAEKGGYGVGQAEIQVAMEHWAPRMVANGVDMNDLERLRRRLTDWADWCSAFSEEAAQHEQLGNAAEAEGNLLSAGEHFRRAALLYHFGKFLFFRDEAARKSASEATVRVYRRGMPYFVELARRVEIPYEGGVLPGVLRLPEGAQRPPVVILVPGLDSVKEELHGYGDDLLRRGMAVLAIDGPGQGELEWTHPMRPDYEVAVRAVLDWLSHVSEVDARRVGLLGVSMGGYYAVRAAALLPRLSAVVAVSGCLRLADHFDHLPALTREAFIVRSGSGDEETARRRAEDFDVTPVLHHLQVPLLLVHGGRDRIFPADDAFRIRDAVGGRVELLYLPEGSHVCNNMPYRYRPQQADWLRRQLGLPEWVGRRP